MTIKRVTETGSAGVNPPAVEIPPVGAPSVLVHGGTGEWIDTGHDALVLGMLMRRILRDEGDEIVYIGYEDQDLTIDGHWILTPDERDAVQRVLGDE